MPYTITTFALPGGARCVRVVGSGHIVKEDANYLMTFIGQGGSMFGDPILILTPELKSISPEARSVFSSGLYSRENQAWCGVVSTNALIRVTTNFLLRVSGYRNSKMFSNEEVAIRWLDERVREDASKSRAT